MLFNRQTAGAAVLLLFSFALRPITSTTVTTATHATSAPVNSTGTCEFRTINYITDTLPQLCFRSSWSNTNASSTKVSENATAGSEGIQGTAVSVSSEVAQETITGLSPSSQTGASDPLSAVESIQSVALETTTPSSIEDLEPSELNEASFLSFEEWKKQALEKAGQANANIGNKKPANGENRRKDSESIQNNLDSVGDEGEIDLDFVSLHESENNQESLQDTESTGAETHDELQVEKKSAKRKDHYRSNDAGITCKERFSYASFDAGATVLKTHPGAKNPKAILIENKDSYMLSECSAKNKFIIIELSEDIWIDTIVLANYEFFSSMVRTFRVSVSDRYPVKMEKWKDAGTYEARNSRDIQAFLVENPQIWARYLRIEFLNHYGNEYYCPLSLVRVHGTRMLESWKETEAIGEDEDTEEGEDDTAEERFVPDAVADVVQEDEKVNAELRLQAEKLLKDAHDLERENTTSVGKVSNMTTPWIRPKYPPFPREVFWERHTCLPSEVPTQRIAPAQEIRPVEVVSSISSLLPEGSLTTTPYIITPTTVSTKANPDRIVATENVTIQATHSVAPIVSNSSILAASSDTATTTASSISSHATKIQNTTATHKNRTSTTSSPPSSLPTIQESFFKAVSRRLQLLETNSTLSLKYIEEQSKILREAFSKVEKKQLQKSTVFLDTLNSTVLAELRSFRQQYDEIWQSTVFSLESQKEESRKEILAISSRLNILADEVVFQKRMSIIQSVLLLLCLGLVIFSRVSSGGPLDFPSMHSRVRNISDYPVESPLQSPPESPEARRDRSWLDPDHRRQRPGGLDLSRSRSRGDGSPPTPVSVYSGSDIGFTPPSGQDDVGSKFIGPEPEEPLHAPQPRTRSRSSTLENPRNVPISQSPQLSRRSRSSTYDGASNSPLAFPSAQGSPSRTPRKRKGSMHSPAVSRVDQAFQRDTWDATGEKTDFVDDPSRLITSLEEGLRPSFSIGRKPLPALPNHGD